jgi:hypothetical protein
MRKLLLGGLVVLEDIELICTQIGARFIPP